MFRWKNMQVVQLNDNRLHKEGDILSEFGMLPNLQKLTLHHNEFLGQVPRSICNLRESTLHSLWVDRPQSIVSHRQLLHDLVRGVQRRRRPGR